VKTIPKALSWNDFHDPKTINNVNTEHMLRCLITSKKTFGKLSN